MRKSILLSLMIPFKFPFLKGWARRDISQSPRQDSFAQCLPTTRAALLGGSKTTVTVRFPQDGHMRRDSPAFARFEPHGGCPDLTVDWLALARRPRPEQLPRNALMTARLKAPRKAIQRAQTEMVCLLLVR
jgi:hypothetical protein